MDPRQVARQFTNDVKAAIGEHLASSVLYGSVPRGEFVEPVSDINVLLLLDDISASSLAQLSPVVRRYAAQHVHPIVVEQREWRRATDVFGIELVEMQDWHELLAGPDPLIGLLVAPSILRLQAERELRGKLLQLHLGMLVADSPERLGQLLTGALPAIVTYLRTALRLDKRDVSRESERTIREGCQLIGADPAGLLRVLAGRRQPGSLQVTLQDPIIDQFNNAAEQLALHIDNVGR